MILFNLITIESNYFEIKMEFQLTWTLYTNIDDVAAECKRDLGKMISGILIRQNLLEDLPAS